MLPRSPKNRFLGSKKLQKKEKGERWQRIRASLWGAVQFALDGGFQYSWVETCPGRSLAPLHQAKRCVCGASNRKSLVFQIFPRVCAYLHDRGFNYPKAAVVVLVCPLTALIDSHIKELKDHAKLANTNIIAAQFAAEKLGNYSWP